MAASNTEATGGLRVAPGGRWRWLGGTRGVDAIAWLVTLVAALSVLFVTVWLVVELWHRSALPRHAFGFRFLLDSVWDPVFGHFGALPFAYGTLVTSAVAMLIAVPLGVGAAIFLAELAPRGLSDTLTFLIELLAAVPSVVLGLVGIFVVVPWVRTSLGPVLKDLFGFTPLFQGPIYGVGFLTAGLVLAIMVLPFIVSISREVLLSVPVELREAALAMGSTKWESTWKVVVPTAGTGILGSIFLGLARALGETMAVTMVIGGTPQIAASLFAPGYSIAAVIADQFSEATGDLFRQSLIELGLVLFGITVLLHAVARLLVHYTTRKARGAA
ncbi:MAG TPA: phosphate ABC transporter permease subunit PstC [Terriglobia bacterium]|nr:phosphate ABC transporter permease subunit PstC [Terriglobia bacterium]